MASTALLSPFFNRLHREPTRASRLRPFLNQPHSHQHQPIIVAPQPACDVFGMPDVLVMGVPRKMHCMCGLEAQPGHDVPDERHTTKVSNKSYDHEIRKGCQIACCIQLVVDSYLELI